MASFILTDVLDSRKYTLNSHTKHLTRWKKREFNLNKINKLLEVTTTESNKTTKIPLQSSKVSVGNQPYGLDKYPLLWIQYFDEDEKSEKEIQIKFTAFDQYEIWFQVIF
jgi:hypothetical protein